MSLSDKWQRVLAVAEVLAGDDRIPMQFNEKDDLIQTSFKPRSNKHKVKPIEQIRDEKNNSLTPKLIAVPSFIAYVVFKKKPYNETKSKPYI